MKPTRRQFIQSALTSGTWLAVGSSAISETLIGEAFAATQEKNMNAEEWKTVKASDNTEMRVFIARPEGSKAKVPAILVLQEVFGVNAYIRDVAKRIAALGYVAAAPELFHRTAPGFEGDYENMAPAMEQYKKVTNEGLIVDLKATYDMLQKDNQVDANRIASVGYCMGGRVSFLANAELPLKAAVSYYGAGIATGLLDRAKDQHGPLLLFWGGKDTHIGRDQQNAIAKALHDAGKLYTDVEFADAEHGFFCNVRKSYNEKASRESWALFTQFLKDYLDAKS